MENEWDVENDCFFIVIHYKGGLDVAEAQWFDLWDYTLASDKKFQFEKEAIEYAQFLAEKNGLDYVGEEYMGILD